MLLLELLTVYMEQKCREAGREPPCNFFPLYSPSLVTCLSLRAVDTLASPLVVL